MSYNYSYKPKRDYHSNKERPYHGHHNNHHNPHHPYGPKRYSTSSGGGPGGNGSGGGNGNGTGMGMSGSNSNSNHYYPPPYYRQHSGHSHGGGHQEPRPHHHYTHHHHHHLQQQHHHPSQHHQNPHHYQHQQQQRTTSPQQRSQTPNMQPCRQQSPSQSQVNTNSSNDASTQKRLWNAVNMEQVANYLEGLYIDAERQEERTRRHGNVPAEINMERLPPRRPRPHSLVMDSSTNEGSSTVAVSVTSPKQSIHPGGFRGDQRAAGGQSSAGANPYNFCGSPMNSGHPSNGRVGDFASGSRGGSSSSSHEQGENGFGYSRRYRH